MKLTFVHAPEDYYDQNYGTQFFPVWAYCLASFVPRQWDIDIIDCRSENITDCEPAEVFAFGGINQDFNSICEKRDLINEVRKREHYIKSSTKNKLAKEIAKKREKRRQEDQNLNRSA